MLDFSVVNYTALRYLIEGLNEYQAAPPDRRKIQLPLSLSASTESGEIICAQNAILNLLELHH
jgi:hypothetical protein